MALRPELHPPALDPEMVDTAEHLVADIVDGLDTGDDVSGPLEMLRALSGHDDLEAEYYRELYSHMTDRDAAEIALTPEAPRVTDLTRAELIDIVERVRSVPSEREYHYYLSLFDRNVPHQEVSDLIHYPAQDWLDRLGKAEPSAEDIVDEALSAQITTTELPEYE